VPFMVRDETIGFLCAFSRQDALLDEDRFQNLLVFCNQIAIGLQKALLYEKVQRLSITDGLTKLYSYRYFRQRLDEELVLAQRYSSRLSMLILDIDHFKKYNDTYGHLAGDQVLQEVGRLLRENSEASHLVARYGGEEMVVIAPETDRERARLLAEKLRTAVETAVFDRGGGLSRGRNHEPGPGGPGR
jgi:diguanylate cyclase (GGDEF)-like protein